jgi:hypothetical protein
MRYRDTAVQVYDVPTSTDPDAVRENRLALFVSMLVMLGLAGFAAFVVFGIVSQKL